MERRGRTTPIAQRRPRGAALERDEQGCKQCSVCLTWQQLDEYGASPVQADGLQPRCKGCVRFATYRVTPEHYASLLEAQSGVCAICERHYSAGKSLAVDHDHSCCPVPRSCGKCVRGLLCTRCVLGVGRLGGSAERAATAAEYLRAWSARGPKVVSPPPPAPRDRRWYAFRLTPDEYAAKLETQGGGCAICGRPPGARALTVDHDHGCCPRTPTCGGCTRDLICGNCNVGMGLFDEDAVRVDRVASYLSGALTSADAFR
ncbi:endonuclease domain-containing protein [Streptomyces sp. NBC_00076]|uniref:endonuclease domain-containing protein n=1 Tax=Streptomyces sp. NBC_00076 TaxID=2975642 RepID=UPI00324D5A99